MIIRFRPVDRTLVIGMNEDERAHVNSKQPLMVDMPDGSTLVLIGADDDNEANQLIDNFIQGPDIPVTDMKSAGNA